MKSKLKERKGITLIALVITIIVLLILAGVSISTLTGENGILTRVGTAKKETEQAEMHEQIMLALLVSKMDDEHNLSVNTGVLEDELYNNLGTQISIYKKGSNEGLPWEVTKGDYTFEITEDATVIKSEASIVVSNIAVKNGETVLEENSKSIIMGTPLTINFEANIKGGKITKIEPSLPYTPADTASVKSSETFKITGIDKDGKTITKEYTLNLKGYYYIPDLKVGDYITGYTLRDVTNAEVATEITNLNAEVNSLSGYETSQTLSQVSNIKWRVLEIDEATGQPTKLISEDGIGTLGLRGAMGYNNAVYLINKACETLYSGEQGKARSITIDDLEVHFNATGKSAKENFTVGEIKFGDPRRYMCHVSYYPQIAKDENKMGIDTETYTAEDGNTYNTLNNSGIDLSSKGNAPYAGTESQGSAYDQASTNGITVTQTWYHILSSISECYENEAYYNIYHSVNNAYFLASRAVYTDAGNLYCSFRVRFASTSLYGSTLYRSNNNPSSQTFSIRPIIDLKYNIQTEFIGTSSRAGYNTWNMQ